MDPVTLDQCGWRDCSKPIRTVTPSFYFCSEECQRNFIAEANGAVPRWVRPAATATGTVGILNASMLLVAGGAHEHITPGQAWLAGTNGILFVGGPAHAKVRRFPAGSLHTGLICYVSTLFDTSPFENIWHDADSARKHSERFHAPYVVYYLRPVLVLASDTNATTYIHIVYATLDAGQPTLNDATIQADQQGLRYT